jgi:hypothetical protein
MELPGKHRHKAAMRRSAPAAGVDAPEISLLRALYQVAARKGKVHVSDTF